MIKLKAPLELKSARAITSANESFGQRIIGNYQLMQAQMEREDLLHVVMSPPEIYIEGGDNVSILQDTRIINNRRTKLDVINNLFNRISVTQEANLTYQDRVYITDVLQRLGVTNIQQFMKQLSLMKQETQNVRELTDLYWDHLKELNQILKEHQTVSPVQSTVQETSFSGDRLYLHEEILNRLQTGAIYQILNNFYSRPVQNTFQISGQELTFSEQQNLVSHILLNRLQTQTVGGKVPFVYRHENYYEENQLDLHQETQESVNSQITSAILLHLADSLYQNMTEKNIRSSQAWVHVENALYQTAENTLKRLSYSMTGQSAGRDERFQLQTRELKSQEREIIALRQLLSLRKQSEQTFRESRTMVSVDLPAEEGGIRTQEQAVKGELGDPGQTYRETEKQTPEGVSLEQINLDLDTQKETEPEIPREQPHAAETGVNQSIREVCKTLEDLLYRRESIQTARTETVLLTPDQSPDQAETIHLSGRELRDRNEIPQDRERRTLPGQEPVQKSDEAKELQLIYQQDEENVFQEINTASEAAYQNGQPPLPEGKSAGHNDAQIIRETSEQILKQIEDRRLSEAANGSASLEDIRRSGLPKAMEDMPQTGREQSAETDGAFYPNGDITQSVHSGDIYHTSFREQETNLYETGQNTADDAYSAFEPGEASMMEQLQEINRRNVENYQRYQQLMTARKEEEKLRKSEQKPAAIRMREESLKALENPQLVIEEHLKREKQTEAAGTAAQQAMEELIPEETRVLYERVLQMQQARQNAPDKGAMEQNASLQELILDIRQTEAESQLRTGELRESQKELYNTTERVIEQRREYETLSAPADSQTIAERQNISLVHKSVENRVDEEELRELLEQNRFLRKDVSVTNRVEESRREENVTVHHETSSTRYEEKEDIEQLIQRGVQRQMGVLSDQIYAKLERRLENEKKRRGY